MNTLSGNCLEGGVTLKADRVLTPGLTLSPGYIQIYQGYVLSVGEEEPTRRTESVALPPGSIVVPGLVEMHVHGAGGYSMASLDQAEIMSARAALLTAGVTTTVASFVSDDASELEAGTELIAEMVEQPADRVARLAGSHLEGPFLAPGRRGCHEKRYLRLPDLGLARGIIHSARGTMRMMTLAPELPGSRALITELEESGVTAAMGHTEATYEETRRAISWGVRVGTHLFNGMALPHHRVPGPALSLLDDSRVTVELINDGVHVHPVVARIAMRAAHGGRLALISDGVSATGAPEGEYLLGRTAIRSIDGRVETSDGNALGGGATSLLGGVRRAVEELGMPLAAAVAAATIVPAEALGVADSAGSLAAGRLADLCVLGADLDLWGVMLGGRWISGPVLESAHSTRGGGGSP